MKQILSLLMTPAFFLTVNAKDDSYTDRYVKMRNADGEGLYTLQRLDSKHIKKEVIDADTAMDVKSKQLLKQAKEMCIVKDDMDSISSDALTALDSRYEVLVSGEQYNIAISILVDFQNDKAKELIIKAQDKEDDILMFTNIIFKKPVRLEDYIDITDMSALVAFGEPKDENDKPLIRFKFSRKVTSDNPLFDSSIAVRLEVVQVDGKYGVKSTPSSKDGEYLIEPRCENEIVLYGSNPGNTYCLTHAHNNYYLHDKYGFILFQADELSPVYVPDSQEVAAFIGKRNDEVGYFLYECPKKYELIQKGSIEGGSWSAKPNYELRIYGCTSIENKGNGEFECIKPDGSVETVIISALKNKNNK